MKFKQQEEPQNNPFLEEVRSLIETVIKFEYAIKTYLDRNGNKYKKMGDYYGKLLSMRCSLNRLFIAIDNEHNPPELTVELKPSNSIEELTRLEEELYNRLKTLGTKGLESNDILIVSYISNLVGGFEHYFCTLDESNSTL